MHLRSQLLKHPSRMDHVDNAASVPRRNKRPLWLVGTAQYEVILKYNQKLISVNFFLTYQCVMYVTYICSTSELYL